MRRTFAMFMAVVMMASGLVIMGAEQTDVKAASVVTSMDYYDSANGATQTKTGVAPVSFGTVMPRINGAALTKDSFKQYEGDLELQVKQASGTNGQWKAIKDVEYFVFNDTWAWEYQQWSADAGGWILWMKLTETTEVRFLSKTNNIELKYTFTLNELEKQSLTSISTSESSIKCDATGTCATHWGQWTFNGGSATYDQVKDDITIKVDNNDGKGFVNLMANPKSGFIWDTNFGIYTDGSGGLWFTGVDHSFTIRLQKKTDSSIYVDAFVTYEEVQRNDWTLTAYNGTSFDANDSGDGAVGFPLPKIGGTEAVKSDVDMFTYEVLTDDGWVILNDIASSGFIYEGNGYNKYSNNQQWGYFIDHVFGLWFQPVKKDTTLRIGYPKNGKNGGAIDGNYVTYTIKGNPDIKDQRSDDMKTNIKVDDNLNSDGFVPDGYKMIWNDEFDGNSVDTSKWNLIEGYLLEEDDINTYGWGNQEKEFYSKDNAIVSDGLLDIKLKKETKTFSQKGDPSKKATAYYSSAKLTSQNNFSVKYGRVDVRAKFPAGNGIWPAIWMLPNDNLYGAWAYSGEIDIAEGRGRVPDKVFGAMHYGGAWPNNLNTSDLLDVKADGLKKSDTTDWHVYSVIWEDDNIKIYCDGYCYFKCTNAEWKSNSDMGNSYAPFDQRFYMIMNLACGGTFDSYNEPGADFAGADMYVDYVRVFQKMVSSSADEKPDKNDQFKTDGANDNLYGDYKLGNGTKPVEPTTKAPETTTVVTTTKKADDGNAALINKIKSSKVAVKKAVKKKSAKKVKVTLKKKVANADGYQVAFYKTKKNAKKNKKALVKKLYKKNKKSFNISHKKLKKVKKLFVRVRAFKTIAGSKYYGKWSGVKKVK